MVVGNNWTLNSSRHTPGLTAMRPTGYISYVVAAAERTIDEAGESCHLLPSSPLANRYTCRAPFATCVFNCCRKAHGNIWPFPETKKTQERRIELLQITRPWHCKKILKINLILIFFVTTVLKLSKKLFSIDCPTIYWYLYFSWLLHSSGYLLDWVAA